MHHILSRNTAMLPKHEKRVFYALAEGKQAVDAPEDALPPAILKLRLTGNDQLILEDKIDLPGKATEMGAHHADFHPDGQHIYVGSTEGNLFVIDSISKEHINTIETGEGTGHTRFVPGLDLALVTNHNGVFVTVIDTKYHTKKEDIYLASGGQFIDEFPKVANEIQQSHTNYVSPDNKFYYAFASAYGIFFEINLETLAMGRTLNTGGVPVQGSFINSDYFSYTAAHSSSGM